MDIRNSVILLVVCFVSFARALEHAATPLTVAQVLAQAGPGDTVRLAPGCHYPPLVITKGGREDAPLTVIAEGVIISSYQELPVEKWQRTDGIWTCPVDFVPEGRGQLLADGRMLSEARWPNVANPERPLLSDFAVATNVSIDFKAPQPEPERSPAKFTLPGLGEMAADNGLAGCVLIWLPENLWVKQSAPVLESRREGEDAVVHILVPYSAAKPWTRSCLPNKTAFVALVGSAGSADSPGEWWLDRTNKMLHLRPTEPPPRYLRWRRNAELGLRVEAPHVSVIGLTLEGCRVVLSASAAGSRLSDLTIRHGAHDIWGAPVHLLGPGQRIEDSDILVSSNTGVNLRGIGASVVNCVIRDCGYLGPGLFLHTWAANQQVLNNTLRGAANHGIALALGSKACRVVGNDLGWFALVASDLAGINCWNSGDLGGSEIAWNHVHHGLNEKSFGSYGIRIDNGLAPESCCNVRIHHNLIWATTRQSLAIWGIGTGSPRYGDAAILVAHNSGDGGFYRGKSGMKSGTNSWAGIRLLNNRLEVKNSIKRAVRGPENFVLKPGDKEVDTGESIADLEHPTQGSAPDLGALELGQPAFLVGAVITARHLPLLRRDGDNLVCPQGRRFPAGARWRVAGGEPVLIEQTVDLPTGTGSALLPAGDGPKLSLDGNTWAAVPRPGWEASRP